MIKFIDKLFNRSNNLDYIASSIKNLSKETPVKKIFDIINNFSSASQIRYVGGCIRKIIKKEKVNDIDLATNLNPQEVCEVLKNNDIDFYETGLQHGTITAVIDEYKFEITSLREDIESDGRRADVRFSLDWKKDASRRDFTINSIYSDIEGNLFDPFNGKNDLMEGIVKFIGNPETRIKEDNLAGISNLSKDRLLSELKKFIEANILTNLSRDKISLELFQNIFPEIKKVKILANPNDFVKKKLEEADFIFLLSVLIIDDLDNCNYFIYKFNISKKDQKRLKVINDFYKEKITVKSFSETNLNKIFYYYGKQSVVDILSYRLFFLKKVDNNILTSIDKFTAKVAPTNPINAKILMEKYNISEGKSLGSKLKIIEEKWVNNNFNITEKQIEEIINY